jgi:hypothetical protein
VVSIGFTGWSGDTGRADRTSIADYLDVRERQRAFAATAAYEDVNDLFLPSPDGPVRLNAVGATASLFEVLRVAPTLGRTFTPADGEPNAPPVSCRLCSAMPPGASRRSSIVDDRQPWLANG